VSVGEEQELLVAVASNSAIEAIGIRLHPFGREARSDRGPAVLEKGRMATLA
jgi:hypothetical protein